MAICLSLGRYQILLFCTPEIQVNKDQVTPKRASKITWEKVQNFQIPEL